ncbi:hypothetical protein RB195_015369 [Necator americanus]|uniref:Uncharacterized protein n=1 Tax=Necator americanus TaxID=51031 RepID=A0ABR1E480_NECAM
MRFPQRPIRVKPLDELFSQHKDAVIRCLVVVDYLSTKHEAKGAEEIPEKEREMNRTSFEEQLVQAKLARGRHLHDEDEENEALLRKSKAKRRRSSEALELRHETTSTGVNTSDRRISSADSHTRTTIPKSTSTTDLPRADSTDDDRIEQIIREEIQKVAMAKLEASNKEGESKTGESAGDSSEQKGTGKEKRSVFDADIDEEFEELPPISDTSDEDYDYYIGYNRQDGNANSDEDHDDDEDRIQKENIAHASILKRSKSGERPNKMDGKRAGTRIISSKMKRSTNDGGKLVRLKGEKKEKSRKPQTDPHMLIRVHRMSETSGDAGDFDVYEDDWEELGAKRSTGKEASRRYIHEKAIFQELTHLKRMQIQYGKVQERILVRSLVSNFCKMHGLDPAYFKFQTFYSWEKFLYDTLSDQLKLIYMEERQRLTQARAVPPVRTTMIDRFDTRIRQARAIPIVNDSVERMRRVYSNSTMTNNRSYVRKKEEKTSTKEGGKRCDCLEKHTSTKKKS